MGTKIDKKNQKRDWMLDSISFLVDQQGGLTCIRVTAELLKELDPTGEIRRQRYEELLGFARFTLRSATKSSIRDNCISDIKDYKKILSSLI